MKTYSSDIEISKYKQKVINSFAKELYKSNLIMWQAIHSASNIMHDPVIDDFYNNEELMLKLAKAYKKICNKKGDEEFANMNLYGADFQDFDAFTSEIQDVIDNLEDEN